LRQELRRQKVRREIVGVALDDALLLEFKLKEILKLAGNRSVHIHSLDGKHLQHSISQNRHDFLARRLLVNFELVFQDGFGDDVFPSPDQHEGDCVRKKAGVFNQVQCFVESFVFYLDV